MDSRPASDLFFPPAQESAYIHKQFLLANKLQ
jgi:hypothetical protein